MNIKYTMSCMSYIRLTIHGLSLLYNYAYKESLKYELMPNGADIRKIRQFCGCSQFVYNRALAYNEEQRKINPDFKFGYAKIAVLLPKWKQKFEWLKSCHSHVLQHSLKDLESAFRNFFRKQADFPKFQKKGLKESFRFPQGCKLEQQ